ncbi:unnamed protein product, partial [marine sediment metagenome]
DAITAKQNPNVTYFNNILFLKICNNNYHYH